MLLSSATSNGLVTLGAVLVGAMASVVGTVFLNRHELTRRQRITIYEDQIPLNASAAQVCLNQVVKGEPAYRWNTGTDAVLLKRAATIAGRKDLARARSIADGWNRVFAVTDWVSPANADNVDARTMSAAAEEQAERLRDLQIRLTDYERWLGRKIGGPRLVREKSESAGR